VLRGQQREGSRIDAKPQGRPTRTHCCCVPGRVWCLLLHSRCGGITVVGGVLGFSARLPPALLLNGLTAVLRGGGGLTATVTATAAGKACGVGVRPRVRRWMRAGGRRRGAGAGVLAGTHGQPRAGVEGRRLGASHQRVGRLRASAGHRDRGRSGVRVRDACASTGGGRPPLPEIATTASAPLPRTRLLTSGCTRACGLAVRDWNEVKPR
jgi:hypothetical protein